MVTSLEPGDEQTGVRSTGSRVAVGDEIRRYIGSDVDTVFERNY
jgi:hypothetical protein